MGGKGVDKKIMRSAFGAKSPMSGAKAPACAIRKDHAQRESQVRLENAGVLRREPVDGERDPATADSGNRADCGKAEADVSPDGGPERPDRPRHPGEHRQEPRNDASTHPARLAYQSLFSLRTATLPDQPEADPTDTATRQEERGSRTTAPVAKRYRYRLPKCSE